ncbi:MAG: porin [Mesorhizobium sp.]|nr:MAG: porin [Mesorhizobium sp.]
MGVGDINGVQNVPDHMLDGDHDTYRKNARFTLKTWTGQETELGTLKTYTETRFNFGNSAGDYEFVGDGWQAGNHDVSLNFAWIQLGGLRVGKDETAFQTFIGYAGNVIDDDLVVDGPYDTNVIQYYFDAGNGFSAVVSLEEGSDVDTIDSYVPHVVGGVKYTQGWGAITGVVAYDSNYEEVTGKVRLDVTASDALSLFIMAGYGTGDDNVFSGGHDFYKKWDGSWAVWGGGSYKINEKTSFNAQAAYDEGKKFALAANIAYDIVPGLTITAEVDYLNLGDSIYHPSSDGIGGVLRFQRSF